MNRKRVLFITPLPPPVHGSSIVSEFIKNSKLINDEMDCHFVNLSTSRSVGENGKFHIVKLFRFFYVVFGRVMELINTPLLL